LKSRLASAPYPLPDYSIIFSSDFRFHLPNFQNFHLPNFFMDLKNLPPAMVSQLANMVEDYVTSSRKKYASAAVPLTDTQRNAMQPFFSAAVLDSARLCVLRGARVSNPSMYAMAKMMGIRNLPDFAAMTAITFVDVIVSHQEFTDALLFHELVHVAQYSQIGLKEFAARFVNGFIQGGSYEEVPLEKMAHALEDRFSQNATQVFSVEDEVGQWLKANGL
jgi:hypothetical protein